MEPAQPNRFAQDLFDGLPPRYDLLAELLSFGQNRRWRRAMVDRVVPAGPRRVLDVATGTAGVALQFARRTSGRSWASTSPRRCCGGVGRTLPGPRAEDRVRSSQAGPRSCRSPTGPSTP